MVSKVGILHMDTDDLSRETYDGILVESEKLSHDLTLNFALLSYDCKDESEFFDEVDKLIREIMQADDCELDDLFFGNPPDKEKLDFTLQKIIGNIAKIKKIPIEERHYD